MTPAELKTYREYLGIPVEWLKKMARVDRLNTIQHWERRGTVPDDVSEAIHRLLRLSESKHDELLKVYSSSDLGDSVTLLKYKVLSDMPPGNGLWSELPVSMYSTVLGNLSKSIREAGKEVSIIYFDKSEYESWLGIRNDNDKSRAQWAKQSHAENTIGQY
jgi:hypothetical protein